MDHPELTRNEIHERLLRMAQREYSQAQDNFLRVDRECRYKNEDEMQGIVAHPLTIPQTAQTWAEYLEETRRKMFEAEDVVKYVKEHFGL